MSELATELTGTCGSTTSLEFFGQTFQDRKLALRKIDDFREQGHQALVDSVAVLAGKTVTMSFRPSSVTSRDDRFSFPCYSLTDNIRQPIEKTVTIQNVDTEHGVVQAGAGEILDGVFDRTWWVRVGNILDIQLETTEPDR